MGINIFLFLAIHVEQYTFRDLSVGICILHANKF